MKKRYYIAYGSNLDVAQMFHRCPGAYPVGKAIIEDYRLMFKGHGPNGYLTIEPAVGKELPVAIWEVTPKDEKNLDRYEGYPTFYYKKDMDITMNLIAGGTKQVRAFAYIMHESYPFTLPSELYADVCCGGYEDFGFNRTYLEEALLYTEEMMR